MFKVPAHEWQNQDSYPGSLTQNPCSESYSALHGSSCRASADFKAEFSEAAEHMGRARTALELDRPQFRFLLYYLDLCLWHPMNLFELQSSYL